MNNDCASTSDGWPESGPTVSLIGVVDDDESVRDAMSSLIRSAGYNCIAFPSAEAFLASDDIHSTDCTVLDNGMPGLSGLELQLRLREMNYRVPIIFVTAHAEDFVRTQALARGAIAFLSKPCSDEALLGAIQAAIASHSRN